VPLREDLVDARERVLDLLARAFDAGLVELLGGAAFPCPPSRATRYERARPFGDREPPLRSSAARKATR
jgi:hypothetical protein